MRRFAPCEDSLWESAIIGAIRLSAAIRSIASETILRLVNATLSSSGGRARSPAHDIEGELIAICTVHRVIRPDGGPVELQPKVVLA